MRKREGETSDEIRGRCSVELKERFARVVRQHGFMQEGAVRAICTWFLSQPWLMQRRVLSGLSDDEWSALGHDIRDQQANLAEEPKLVDDAVGDVEAAEVKQARKKRKAR